ncbi:hypothetical protein B7495_04780 [Cryobacterium sp. LW097]|nr:hypothetical protein B7495_04780 [Cryobacterium sp. LW097]
MVVALMLFVAGVSAIATGLFILGALSTVGWLVLGGLQWKPTEQPANAGTVMPPARHWLDRKAP